MSNLRLTIDLLPKGAWGHDFSKTLPQKEWDTLRNFCYKKAEYRCAVCGKSGEQLEAHEVWDFNIGNQTQTLKDIIALCAACHGVKHMRNSQRIGYGEQAKAHFMKVNKCSVMEFAKNYTEAELLFEERNKILRWKLKAELEKFGGKGIQIKERYIPIIIDPYKEIDWENIKHIRTGHRSLTDFPMGLSFDAEIIILQQPIKTGGEVLRDISKAAVYFAAPAKNSLPPKILSVITDNYSGIITVISDRVNKIQWLSEGKIISTQYNNAGKFTAKFSVEDLTGKNLYFVLTGDGGQTVSQMFVLQGIKAA